MASQYFHNTIWTNHALAKLKERKLTQSTIYAVFNKPDNSAKISRGCWKFTKKISQKTYTVIAKQNNEHEWIIVSCWVDPPNTNTPDYFKKTRYKKYLRSSILIKIKMQIEKFLFGKSF